MSTLFEPAPGVAEPTSSAAPGGAPTGIDGQVLALLGDAPLGLVASDLHEELVVTITRSQGLGPGPTLVDVCLALGRLQRAGSVVAGPWHGETCVRTWRAA